MYSNFVYLKESLVNKWECIGSSLLAGEDILAVAWFHTGVQVCAV